jgi:ABC-type phosphate/phosphonate transport system substrate-binding protein
MSRTRHPLLLILAVLLAGLFGNSAFAQEGSRAQELKFGFTPVLSEPEMRAEFEPLMNYLSEAIGRKVTLYIAKDYGDLRTQMDSAPEELQTARPVARRCARIDERSHPWASIAL